MFIDLNLKQITFEAKDSIGIITINRPGKLNALNAEVLQEMRNVLTVLGQKGRASGLRGLILTGEGEKAFIAGADIAAMQNMTPSQAKTFGALGQEVSLLLEEHALPVVAAVNGFALGGGCEMAISCDFILCTSNAVFGLPELKLGLIPGFGGTQRMAKLVGISRAKEWTFSGRNISAQEALDAGLVLEVCPDKMTMLDKAQKLIASFIPNSPIAISHCKAAINAGSGSSVRAGLKEELMHFEQIFSSLDAKEGLSAFIEKRKPNFQGR